MDKQEIIALARETMATCKLNDMAAIGRPGEKIWVDVQGGYAAGNDPYFPFLKEDIGDFFLLPAEIFERLYPGSGKKNEDLTVLSLVFIYNDDIRNKQAAGSGKEPCLEWLYARNSWNAITKDVSTRFVEAMKEKGITAAGVDLCPGFEWMVTEKYNLATNWSHRHAAHAAGLGTFGLCDGLISKWGKAVRYSTFILDAKIPADEKPYKSYHDWCLFYATGSCSACMKACPGGAITEKGHDKPKCQEFCGVIRQKHLGNPALNPDIEFGCGLCQGNVPCQKGVPKGLWKDNPNDK